MDKYEVLLKFDDLVYYSGKVENYSNDDNLKDAAKARKQGNGTRMLLLSEFGRLTREVERLTAEIKRLKGAQEGRCSIDVELERK